MYNATLHTWGLTKSTFLSFFTSNFPLAKSLRLYYPPTDVVQYIATIIHAVIWHRGYYPPEFSLTKPHGISGSPFPPALVSSLTYLTSPTQSCSEKKLHRVWSGLLVASGSLIQNHLVNKHRFLGCRPLPGLIGKWKLSLFDPKSLHTNMRTPPLPAYFPSHSYYWCIFTICMEKKHPPNALFMTLTSLTFNFPSYRQVL